MTPPQPHDHLHLDTGGHHHAAIMPHPSQSPPWSILRMTVVSRLGIALAVSALLWAFVLLAMR
ncbi:hypothetical protein [Rhodopseudomonas palustris]|uniref:Uncharacterized protein n=1 Tax=Rhodopseudomonas palustris (strain BisB18) TaxID=316056 RepID=Q20WY7_RHOPB